MQHRTCEINRLSDYYEAYTRPCVSLWKTVGVCETECKTTKHYESQRSSEIFQPKHNKLLAPQATGPLAFRLQFLSGPPSLSLCISLFLLCFDPYLPARRPTRTAGWSGASDQIQFRQAQWNDLLCSRLALGLLRCELSLSDQSLSAVIHCDLHSGITPHPIQAPAGLCEL